jgi:hypothetical protein
MPMLEAKGTLLQKINPDANVIIHLKPIKAAKTVAQTEVSSQP